VRERRRNGENDGGGDALFFDDMSKWNHRLSLTSSKSLSMQILSSCLEKERGKGTAVGAPPKPPGEGEEAG